jgi:dienelactone hydrolase
MLVELTTVRTEDGCLLDGAYWPAEGAASSRADACVLIHGAGGHAFSPLQRTLAEGLARGGMGVLALSTRGHDVVSRTATASGPRPGGVAFEDLDEAPLDLRAAMAWLSGRGHRRIALAGHSLGAVKSILTAASGANAACVIALSPLRFCYEKQAAADNGPRFLETFVEAQALVAAGNGETLIRAEAPIASYFAAAQYVKKYGPEDRFDYVRALDTVSCPVFLLYGSLETNLLAAVGGDGSNRPALLPEREQITTVNIAGADHVYTGGVEQVLTALRGWLQEQPAAEQALGAGASGTGD